MTGLQKVGGLLMGLCLVLVAWGVQKLRTPSLKTADHAIEFRESDTVENREIALESQRIATEQPAITPRSHRERIDPPPQTANPGSDFVRIVVDASNFLPNVVVNLRPQEPFAEYENARVKSGSSNAVIEFRDCLLPEYIVTEFPSSSIRRYPK